MQNTNNGFGQNGTIYLKVFAIGERDWGSNNNENLQLIATELSKVYGIKMEQLDPATISALQTGIQGSVLNYSALSGVTAQDKDIYITQENETVGGILKVAGAYQYMSGNWDFLFATNPNNITFLQLSDTPADYNGKNGMGLVVDETNQKIGFIKFALDSDLDAERTARENGDSGLQTQITSNKNDILSNASEIGINSQAITSESSIRQSADDNLSALITVNTNQIADHETRIQTLEHDIDNDISGRHPLRYVVDKFVITNDILNHTPSDKGIATGTRVAVNDLGGGALNGNIYHALVDNTWELLTDRFQGLSVILNDDNLIYTYSTPDQAGEYKLQADTITSFLFATGNRPVRRVVEGIVDATVIDAVPSANSYSTGQRVALEQGADARNGNVYEVKSDDTWLLVETAFNGLGIVDLSKDILAIFNGTSWVEQDLSVLQQKQESILKNWDFSRADENNRPLNWFGYYTFFGNSEREEGEIVNNYFKMVAQVSMHTIQNYFLQQQFLVDNDENTNDINLNLSFRAYSNNDTKGKIKIKIIGGEEDALNETVIVDVGTIDITTIESNNNTNNIPINIPNSYKGKLLNIQFEFVPPTEPNDTIIYYISNIKLTNPAYDNLRNFMNKQMLETDKNSSDIKNNTDNINLKADKVPTATEDNIPTFDANGNIKDSGVPIGNVGSGGSSALATRTITDDTIIAETDDIIVCDNSVKVINITLPDATSFKKKRYTIFSQSNSYAITLSTTGTNPREYFININKAGYAITVFPNGSDVDDWILVGDNSNKTTIQDVLDGLFLYNKFETLSSNIFPSDVGEDLQENNGATIDAGGVVGNCVLLDGVDDYLTANHNSNQVNAVNYDFIFWIKLNDANDKLILHKGGAYEQIEFNTNNQLGITWITTGGNVQAYTPELTGLSPAINLATDGEWHMIEVSGEWDGTNIITNWYVDNRNVYSEPGGGSNSNSFATDSTEPINIGYTGVWGHFNGSLDILRMYNRILTDEERTKIYNAGHGLQG